MARDRRVLRDDLGRVAFLERGRSCASCCCAPMISSTWRIASRPTWSWSRRSARCLSSASTAAAANAASLARRSLGTSSRASSAITLSSVARSTGGVWAIPALRIVETGFSALRTLCITATALSERPSAKLCTSTCSRRSLSWTSIELKLRPSEAISSCRLASSSSTLSDPESRTRCICPSTRPSGLSTSREIIRLSTASTIASRIVDPSTASHSMWRPSNDTSRGTMKLAAATGLPSPPAIGTAICMVSASVVTSAPVPAQVELGRYLKQLAQLLRVDPPDHHDVAARRAAAVALANLRDPDRGDDVAEPHVEVPRTARSLPSSPHRAAPCASRRPSRRADRRSRSLVAGSIQRAITRLSRGADTPCHRRRDWPSPAARSFPPRTPWSAPRYNRSSNSSRHSRAPNSRP